MFSQGQKAWIRKTGISSCKGERGGRVVCGTCETDIPACPGQWGKLAFGDCCWGTSGKRSGSAHWHGFDRSYLQMPAVGLQPRANSKKCICLCLRLHAFWRIQTRTVRKYSEPCARRCCFCRCFFWFRNKTAFAVCGCVSWRCVWLQRWWGSAAQLTPLGRERQQGFLGYKNI